MHSPIKRNVQHKINTKKLKPGLVASYDIWPENRGPILVLAPHKSNTYPLTYSPGHTRDLYLWHGGTTGRALLPLYWLFNASILLTWALSF